MENDPGNCYVNTVAFTASETRSLMCYSAIFGQHVYLYKLQLSTSMSLCEVEIFQWGEQTDIRAPSWQSDWLDLPWIGTESVVASHGLGTLPIYGRLLLNSGQFHENYIFETGYFRDSELSSSYGIEGVLQFGYTETDYYLDWDRLLFERHLCLNTTKYKHAMKNHMCLYKENHRYKVQLWTACAFPRPTYRSPWMKPHNDSVVMPHGLGVIPDFGYIQITLHDGITFQVINQLYKNVNILKEKKTQNLLFF